MAAVNENAVSTVVGYQLKKGYFNPSTPNLPQRIAILGEANTANQSGLSTNPQEITSAAQAATLYGSGSPIHLMARILFPSNGGNVGVPVIVYPQVAAVGGAAKVMTLTPTGTATAAGTIFVNIAGRNQIDGGSYQINIAVGDTPTLICDKIRAAVAAALSCPLIGSGTSTFVGTVKWTGLSSQGVNMTVDTNNTNTGVTFAVVVTTPGTGTPTVTTSLNMFGNEWNTLVINSYGLVTAVMDELEAFNGIPDNTTPTGRYSGTIWRPFLALSGTVLDNPTSLTSGSTRPANVTIVPCPAPLSEGLPFEAAANMAFLVASVAQNSPHQDIIGQSYPDMPPPLAGVVPAMNSYTVRDSYVKLGCSTVNFVSGRYEVCDLVTTYNPTGEFPPFYRWARDMWVHFNLRFQYHLVEKAELVGKTLSKDSDTVLVTNVIKPSMWKGRVAQFIDDMVAKALLTDAEFAKSTISVTINSGNPNRLDTEFSDKITGVIRISATTVTSGFNFTT